MYQVFFETISPYGNDGFGVEQKSSRDEDFRPRMPIADEENKFNYKEKVILELIKKSWAHEPAARPDFSVICKTIEPFVPLIK